MASYYNIYSLLNSYYKTTHFGTVLLSYGLLSLPTLRTLDDTQTGLDQTFDIKIDYDF